MSRTHHWVAVTVAAVCLALAVVWLFVPQVLLWTWQVDTNDAAVLVARRGGALFLGLAVIFALTRNAEPSPTRRAISFGVALAFAMLAVLGFRDHAAGQAGLGIWLAIVVELALALALIVGEIL